jgi:hypothetical protein
MFPLVTDEPEVAVLGRSIDDPNVRDSSPESMDSSLLKLRGKAFLAERFRATSNGPGAMLFILVKRLDPCF